MEDKINKPEARRNPLMVWEDGVTSSEELPLPIVHYPRMFGSFMAFSRVKSSEPYFCECARQSLLNYIQINRIFLSPIQSRFQSKRDFPKKVHGLLAQYEKGTLKELPFKSSLCHRCNVKTPYYHYGHANYLNGSPFYEAYGWYIDQALLRFGITHSCKFFLPDFIPSELFEDYRVIIKAYAEYEDFFNLFDKYHKELKKLHKPDPVQEYRDKAEARRLQQCFVKARRPLIEKIENMVRQEFGFKRIGEAWVQETVLFKILKEIFPNEIVIHHHRPKWLNGLEIDVFIPHISTGFEYQGQQHYQAIDAWGGEVALAKTQARDKTKIDCCQQNGVKLIHIKYTEKLTKDFVKELLNTSNIFTIDNSIKSE